MFRPYGDGAIKDLLAVLPVSSTYGYVSSSDVGKLVFETSNQGGLMPGSTGDVFIGGSAVKLLGIVANVPTPTSPGSTIPFFIWPIVPGKLYEAEYSTTYSANLPATTDIGKYLGSPNTTTIAAGAYLSMAGIGNAAGTTSGLFFRISDPSYSTAQRKILGTFHSTHLAL